jgi:hypothetical protein
VSTEERVKQKLLWIEGFPTLNHYAVDVFNHCEDRHQLQEIGQDYEDEWPYRTRNNDFMKYMSGNLRMSIEEIESVTAHFLRLLIENLYLLPIETINRIASPEE